MERYLGVKLVDAEPCSQDQYAGAKNFGDLSKKSGGIDREGYKVVYEDGYTSWSPKDVFEKAYRQIKDGIPLDKGNWLPHQERVAQEARELREKSDKLYSFITSNNIYNGLDLNEQTRLKQQLMAMQYYLTILIERIENF